jgi:dihydrofolate reductase
MDKLYNDIKNFEKKFSMIAAVSDNNTIGDKNKLLWNLPNDLKRFKKLTMNKIIIMGKNTFLSLPNGALKDRINIILCNDNEEFLKRKEISKFNTGIVKLKTVQEVFNFIYNFEKKKIENPDGFEQFFDTDEYFIIGGATIYSLFLPNIHKLYLTQVHANFEGDAKLVDYNSYDWKISYKRNYNADNLHKYNYTYLTLEK